MSGVERRSDQEIALGQRSARVFRIDGRSVPADVLEDPPRIAGRRDETLRLRKIAARRADPVRPCTASTIFWNSAWPPRPMSRSRRAPKPIRLKRRGPLNIREIESAMNSGRDQ